MVTTIDYLNRTQHVQLLFKEMKKLVTNIRPELPGKERIKLTPCQKGINFNTKTSHVWTATKVTFTKSIIDIKA